MDLGELATVGATTLVTAMTTGAWEQVRKRIARLLGRHDEAEQRALEADLNRAREALAGATGDQVARLLFSDRGDWPFVVGQARESRVTCVWSQFRFDILLR